MRYLYSTIHSLDICTAPFINIIFKSSVLQVNKIMLLWQWVKHHFLTANTDFKGQTSVTVTFAPSETEKIVNVSVLNDDTFESTETFTAMLTAVPGSMAMIGTADTATATITDDDSKFSFISVVC